MSKLLKLTGLKTFIGGRVGNHNIDHGDVCRFNDDDANALLDLERSGPPEVEPIKYFTEVKDSPNVAVKYDFENDIKVYVDSAPKERKLGAAIEGNPDADEVPGDSEQPPGVTKSEAKAVRKQLQEVPVTKSVRNVRAQKHSDDE